ncbi:MAG: hypothetical protein ABIH39_06035, partial [Candidatus Margulisiibacteriota bacterium]
SKIYPNVIKYYNKALKTGSIDKNLKTIYSNLSIAYHKLNMPWMESKYLEAILNLDHNGS